MTPPKKHVLYRLSKYLKLIFFTWDIFLLIHTYVLSFYLRFGVVDRFWSPDSISVLIFASMSWLLLTSYMGEYKFMRVEPIDKILSRSLKIVMMMILFVFLMNFIAHLPTISRLRMLYFYGLFAFFIFIFRIVYIRILKYFRRKGFNFRNVVIIGATSVGREIQEILEKDHSFGYRVLGYFDNEAASSEGVNILGRVDDLPAYVEEQPIHEIYIAGLYRNEQVVINLIDFCEKNMIRVKFVPDFKKFTMGRRVLIDFYENTPVLIFRKEPLENPYNRVLKTVFDFIFALLVVLLIFPWLFPLLALLIKLGSKGPVFFKQLRSGEDNKEFWCWKFRTMRVNTLSDQLQATRNDPRVTRVGRFLRKTNLDELPQFINVLLRNMSIVGPRPHMLKHTEEYSEQVQSYLVRHYVRPGITGWAQVNGYRGEIKNIEMLEKRVQADIWYIENWTILLDINIIYKTVTNMLRGEKNAV